MKKEKRRNRKQAKARKTSKKQTESTEYAWKRRSRELRKKPKWIRTQQQPLWALSECKSIVRCIASRCRSVVESGSTLHAYTHTRTHTQERQREKRKLVLYSHPSVCWFEYFIVFAIRIECNNNNYIWNSHRNSALRDFMASTRQKWGKTEMNDDKSNTQEN